MLIVGLVVSTCVGGAFVGSLFSGSIADGVGRRRAFQLCALPMIIGASLRSATIHAIYMICCEHSCNAYFIVFIGLFFLLISGELA